METGRSVGVIAELKDWPTSRNSTLPHVAMVERSQHDRTKQRERERERERERGFCHFPVDIRASAHAGVSGSEFGCERQ